MFVAMMYKHRHVVHLLFEAYATVHRPLRTSDAGSLLWMTRAAELLLADDESGEAEAMAAVESALKLAPNSPRLATLKLIASRKFAEALPALASALKLAPGNAQLLALRRQARRGLEEAERQSRQAEAELLAMFGGGEPTGATKTKKGKKRKGQKKTGKKKKGQKQELRGIDSTGDAATQPAESKAAAAVAAPATAAAPASRPAGSAAGHAAADAKGSPRKKTKKQLKKERQNAQRRARKAATVAAAEATTRAQAEAAEGMARALSAERAGAAVTLQSLARARAARERRRQRQVACQRMLAAATCVVFCRPRVPPRLCLVPGPGPCTPARHSPPLSGLRPTRVAPPPRQVEADRRRLTIGCLDGMLEVNDLQLAFLDNVPPACGALGCWERPRRVTRPWPFGAPALASRFGTAACPVRCLSSRSAPLFLSRYLPHPAYSFHVLAQRVRSATLPSPWQAVRSMLTREQIRAMTAHLASPPPKPPAAPSASQSPPLAGISSPPGRPASAPAAHESKVPAEPKGGAVGARPGGGGAGRRRKKG